MFVDVTASPSVLSRPVTSVSAVRPGLPSSGARRTNQGALAAEESRTVKYTYVASSVMFKLSNCPVATTTGWHLPPRQVPPWQLCPQIPQFAASVITSTQAVGQAVRLHPHAPFMQ